jgi:hypothetical protein
MHRREWSTANSFDGFFQASLHQNPSSRMHHKLKNKQRWILGGFELQFLPRTGKIGLAGGNITRRSKGRLLGFWIALQFSALG